MATVLSQSSVAAGWRDYLELTKPKVVLLMLWFWLSAFVVLLGAEINGEMERQTRRDTTVGEPRPLGERGAFVADTLGPRRPWRRDGKGDDSPDVTPDVPHQPGEPR